MCVTWMTSIQVRAVSQASDGGARLSRSRSRSRFLKQFLSNTFFLSFTDKHQLEMSIIYKYSPFHNEEDLFKQFDLIKGSHGTLICIYNVKLLDNGDPELGEDLYLL